MQRVGYACVCKSCRLDRLGNVLRIDGCPAECFFPDNAIRNHLSSRSMLRCGITRNWSNIYQRCDCRTYCMTILNCVISPKLLMCWIQSISLKSNEPPIRRLYIWISLYIQAQSEILDTEHHDTQVEVYHQISMPPEFITKTAVITPFGLFDYLRRPIGYHIVQVCRGLDFVYAYIEDVLFASSNPEEHKLPFTASILASRSVRSHCESLRSATSFRQKLVSSAISSTITIFTSAEED